MTFEQHLAAKGRSPKTISNYKQDIKFCQELGIKDDPAHAIGVFLSLSHKPNTIRRRLAALLAYYGWKVKAGEIERNPYEGYEFEAKYKSPRPDILSVEEVRALLAVQSENAALMEARDALELVYWTGARVSELLNMSPRSFEARGLVRILGKGNKERIQPIPEALAARLAALPGERVFSLSYSTLRLRFQELAKLAGVTRRVNPHVFRHTAATHLLENGTDLRTLQEWLGHASIGTTQTYTHISKERITREIMSRHPLAQTSK